MKKITCEICGVKTCRIDGHKRVFMAKFPLDEERCKQWVKVTGKEDLVYVPIEKLHQLKYLCEKHFRSKDFKKKKTQLKKTAIPSLEISSTPLSDDILVGFPLHCIASSQLSPAQRTDNVQLSHSNVLCEPTPSTSTSQTDTILETNCCTAIPSTSTSDPDPRFGSPTLLLSPRKHQDRQAVPMTPQKRKLYRKLKSSQILIKNLQKKVNKIDNITSPLLKSFIDSTIANQSRKPKGKRWTKLIKTVAMSLYKKSPEAYRYLSQLLPMPSIRTLQTVFRKK